MEKIIKIGGRDVPMKATANTPKRYRNEFNKDLLVDITALYAGIGKNGEIAKTTDMAVIENLAYIMAKQADDSIGTMEEWLDEFGTFDLYNAMPEIIKVWGDSTVTTSTAKKK